MAPLRETLEKSIDETEWNWIAPHLQRDAVIWVSADLDLVQVAVEIAENKTQNIQKYLDQKAIAKPTPANLAEWNLSPTKKFKVLVVQPFVLIQDTGP